VPSIDIMGGRAVQLRRGRELALDGGDPMAWLERFALAGEVAIVDLDAALGSGSNTDLIRAMVRRADCRVGGGIRDYDTARAWLDAGATRIVLGTRATVPFCKALPRDRVIAAVDSVQGKVVVDGWRTPTGKGVLDTMRELAPHVGGFLLTQVEHEGMMGGFDMDLVRAAVSCAGDARVTAAGGITMAADIARLDAEGADAQVGMALYTGALSLGDAVAASLGAGIGGLWPTVVADDSGLALGLAWSSPESLRRAVDERAGIYWSRSRNALWVKGESSGNRQELLSVSVDCDRDALRFIVRQAGSGFCHRGTWSCFGDRFTAGTLERVVRSRLASGDTSSGTRALVTDPGLLAAKVREEGAELAMAELPDDVVHESADLLYLVIVALARAGRSLTDVEQGLGRRNRRLTRRPKGAKP
jgi:phosphoribosyl-ATP pyrophosphohydrolase